MTTFSIGSVSSGTMRAEDLIPCFVDLLDEYKEDLSLSLPVGATFGQTEAVKMQVAAIDNLLAGIEQRMKDQDYYESEHCDWDLEELFEQLNAAAPDGCYFGAHPGDGADYGFWPCD